MTNKIIKQIWNQRRMNSWIFIEIIIAGFFLWTVIDVCLDGYSPERQGV